MCPEKELHQMNPDELGNLFPVIIKEPDKKWTANYLREKARILQVFDKSDIESIEHIGSTAVPGLKAKPTIDILIEISDKVPDDRIIDNLKSTGYEYIHRPENPPPHMMFVKGYTKQGFRGQAFHIHVRYKGDWDEIYFRDYLRNNRKAAKAYEDLKLKLAEKYKNDRETYTSEKSDFIEKINKLARQKYQQE
jgi:GrpB-like predicted nucleotidyltransferase (UPF0157 family)